MSKKYEYIDCELQWVRKLPKQWSLKRIKDVALLQSGDAITSLSITDNDEFPVFGGNGLRGYTDSYNHDGSYVLIGRQGALCGNINYAHGKFFASEHAIIVYPHFPINIFWLGELLREMNLNQYSNAAAQPGLAVEKIKNLKLPVPPRKEQTAIANYLDKACSDIDKVIELKSQQRANVNERCKSLIAEIVTKGLNKNVNLVECRISWLKTIPENWTVSRLKSIADLRSGDGITSENISDEGEFPVYGGNGLRGYTNSFTHEGDFVLIGRQGALCGNINYASGKFFASEHAVVLTPIWKYDKLWLGELLRYMNLNQYSNAAAQPGLSVEKIRNLHIPLPKYEEQVLLSYEIKKVIKNTELLVEKIDQQITTLEDYKKALIHEVVTGKKQVYEVDKKVSKIKAELNAVE